MKRSLYIAMILVILCSFIMPVCHSYDEIVSVSSASTTPIEYEKYVDDCNFYSCENFNEYVVIAKNAFAQNEKYVKCVDLSPSVFGGENTDKSFTIRFDTPIRLEKAQNFTIEYRVTGAAVKLSESFVSKIELYADETKIGDNTISDEHEMVYATWPEAVAPMYIFRETCVLTKGEHTLSTVISMPENEKSEFFKFALDSIKLIPGTLVDEIPPVQVSKTSPTKIEYEDFIDSCNYASNENFSSKIITSKYNNGKDTYVSSSGLHPDDFGYTGTELFSITFEIPIDIEESGYYDFEYAITAPCKEASNPYVSQIRIDFDGEFMAKNTRALAGSGKYPVLLSSADFPLYQFKMTRAFPKGEHKILTTVWYPVSKTQPMNFKLDYIKFTPSEGKSPVSIVNKGATVIDYSEHTDDFLSADYQSFKSAFTSETSSYAVEGNLARFYGQASTYCPDTKFVSAYTPIKVEKSGMYIIDFYVGSAIDNSTNSYVSNVVLSCGETQLLHNNWSESLGTVIITKAQDEENWAYSNYAFKKYTKTIWLNEGIDFFKTQIKKPGASDNMQCMIDAVIITPVAGEVDLNVNSKTTFEYEDYIGNCDKSLIFDGDSGFEVVENIEYSSGGKYVKPKNITVESLNETSKDTAKLTIDMPFNAVKSGKFNLNTLISNNVNANYGSKILVYIDSKMVIGNNHSEGTKIAEGYADDENVVKSYNIPVDIEAGKHTIKTVIYCPLYSDSFNFVLDAVSLTPTVVLNEYEDTFFEYEDYTEYCDKISKFTDSVGFLVVENTEYASGGKYITSKGLTVESLGGTSNSDTFFTIEMPFNVEKAGKYNINALVTLGKSNSYCSGISILIDDAQVIENMVNRPKNNIIGDGYISKYTLMREYEETITLTKGFHTIKTKVSMPTLLSYMEFGLDSVTISPVAEVKDNGDGSFVVSANCGERISGAVIAAVYNEEGKYLGGDVKEVSNRLTVELNPHIPYYENATLIKIFYWEDFGKTNAPCREVQILTL